HWIVAELVRGAGKAVDSAAGLRGVTWALMRLLHPRGPPLAVVPVGHPVAAAFGKLAELALAASNPVDPPADPRNLAGPVVVLLDAGHETIAIVGVGDSVAAADGIEDIGAALRPGDA